MTRMRLVGEKRAIGRGSNGSCAAHKVQSAIAARSASM